MLSTGDDADVIIFADTGVLIFVFLYVRFFVILWQCDELTRTGRTIKPIEFQV